MNIDELRRLNAEYEQKQREEKARYEQEEHRRIIEELAQEERKAEAQIPDILESFYKKATEVAREGGFEAPVMKTGIHNSDRNIDTLPTLPRLVARRLHLDGYSVYLRKINGECELWADW